MISKREAQIIKDLLGCTPTLRIEEHFLNSGLRNRNGNPFPASFINRVLNGKVTHQIIEENIWEFFKEEVKRRTEEEKEREQALEAAQNLTNA